MALFRTRSAAVSGIEAHLIDVEVDKSRKPVNIQNDGTAERTTRREESASMASG